MLTAEKMTSWSRSSLFSLFAIQAQSMPQCYINHDSHDASVTLCDYLKETSKNTMAHKTESSVTTKKQKKMKILLTIFFVSSFYR